MKILGSGVHDVQVASQNHPDNQHDQPDGCGLLKVFSERFEVPLYNIAFLVPYNLKDLIMHGREGCPCGDDRNHADNGQQIQNHQVRHLVHKLHEGAVDV